MPRIVGNELLIGLLLASQYTLKGVLNRLPVSAKSNNIIPTATFRAFDNAFFNNKRSTLLNILTHGGSLCITQREGFGKG